LLQRAKIYQETSAQVHFEIQLDEALPEFNFDPDQMKRVFVNLIDNAVAAVQAEGQVTGQAGLIQIKTEYQKQHQVLKISISDNGVGIPQRDRVRVFEPYFSTKEKGTGLGLPIVKSIIEDHNGVIRALENIPKGTKMYIEMPVTPLE